MKPFVQQPLKLPSELQLALRLVPKGNFLIAVNNLLAEKTLDNLSRAQIIELEQIYKVKDSSSKFHEEFCDFLKQFLIETLGDSHSKVSDIELARNLQTILGLSELDFEKVLSTNAIELFKQKTNSILSYMRKFGDQEKNEINKWQAALSIPADKAEKTVNDCRISIVQSYYKKIIEDRRISPQELLHAEILSQSMQVILELDDESRKVFDKLKRLWNIENEELPIIEPDIYMPKNEECYLQINAILFENRKVTKSIGYAGPALRIKIAKGLYFRAGNIGLKPHSEEELTKIDDGILYVTNKRILFVGNNQNKTYKYHQIIDLTQFSDGIQLVKDSGRSPFFKTYGEEPEIILAYIARILKDTLV